MDVTRQRFGVQREDGRYLRQCQRHRCASPVRHASCRHQFVGEAQLAGDSDPRSRPQGGGHRVEQLLCPIGRLDHEDGLVASGRTLFECAQPIGPCLSIDRKIAGETEVLPIHAGCHQGQEQGARTDQRHDLNPLGVRQRNETGPRIGHRRTPGLRQQSGVDAGQRRCEQSGQCVRRCVFAQLADVQLLDRCRQRQSLEDCPGGTGVLGHEMGQRRHDLDRRRGQYPQRILIGAQRCRDEEQAARAHRADRLTESRCRPRQEGR